MDDGKFHDVHRVNSNVRYGSDPEKHIQCIPG